MQNFTGHNVPGCVGELCYTAFYEGDVATELFLADGSQAPTISWNPNNADAPQVDRVTILKVSEMPQSPESWTRLQRSLMNARLDNIRLILPRGKYPPHCRVNIDSESIP